MKKRVNKVLLAFLLSLTMIADSGMQGYAADATAESVWVTQNEESRDTSGTDVDGSEESKEDESVESGTNESGTNESGTDESGIDESESIESESIESEESKSDEPETYESESIESESVESESDESETESGSEETESTLEETESTEESSETDVSESDELLESAEIGESEELLKTKSRETEETLADLASAYVPERIQITPTSVTMYEGDSYQLNAVIYPETVSQAPSGAPSITWKSSDESVATVTVVSAASGTATVVANSTGSSSEKDVTITAYVTGSTSVAAECKVKVYASDAVRNGDIQSTGVVLSNDIWVTKIEDDDLVYTGKAIKPAVCVYYKHKQLKENTDYKLEYKNATNASDNGGSAYVTVTMTGQYKGKKSVYYQIKPRPIFENGKLADGFTFSVDEMALSYNKKVQKYVPTIRYKVGSSYKTLVNKKDFTISYSNNAPVGSQEGEPLTVTYQVSGTGNFCTVSETDTTAVPTYSYYIVGKNQSWINLSKAKVYLENPTIAFEGRVVTGADLGITIKLPGEKEKIDPTTSSDFIVETAPLEDISAGSQWVTIRPSESGKSKYKGAVQKKYTLKGYSLKNSVTFQESMWKSEITYRKADAVNGIKQDTTGVLKNGSQTLVEGKDYTVTYSNNKKAGTAKATFKGMGLYAGTMTKSFKIVPDCELTVTAPQNVAYTKGGAVPAFVVRDTNGTELVKNTDYTVKVTNNKEVGATAECTIRGKGNYSKSNVWEGRFQVTAADISKCRVVVADKKYKDSENAYKSTPTVYDTNGKKLEAGKDYDKAFVYKSNDTVITGIPTTGQEITVEITGKGNYQGTVTGSYHIYDATKSISKLKITIDPQIYTGNAVKPSIAGGDIHVYLSASDQKNKINEQSADKFVKVVSYSNNIKSGKAKITLAGVGEYGGTKTYRFTIKRAELVDNSVKSISFSETMYRVENVGQKINVSISYNPATASVGGFEWKLSDESVAKITSIDASQLSAVIEFTQKDTSCTLTVKEKDSGLSASCTLACGELKSVLSYGAIPNDGKNDVTAFLMAIQAAADKVNASSDSTHRETVYVPAGVYDIYTDNSDVTKDRTIVLWGAKRIDIVLEDGAVIKGMPNDRKNYDVIGFVMCDDCTITGGKVMGDRDQHINKGGEWGHCISVYQSTNITISNMEICNGWGDGIWIGDYSEKQGSSKITVKNCNIHNNRRNNISLTCAKNITIDSCKLNDANGTDPQFGIDIETNYDDLPCENITLVNTEIKGNKKGAVGIITAANNILLKNCDITGEIHNMRGDNVRLENTKVNGETKSGSIPRQQ